MLAASARGSLLRIPLLTRVPSSGRSLPNPVPHPPLRRYINNHIGSNNNNNSSSDQHLRSTVVAMSSNAFGSTAGDGASYGFSSAFDSGNGELVSATKDVLTVRMREEPFTEKDGRKHFQWFHFRVTGAGGSNLKVVIDNADQASYPDGWHGYKAFYSADRETWHRVQTTSYVDGKLVIDLQPVPSDCVHLAYFVPYSYEKHLDLVARASDALKVTHHSLGTTLDGHPLDCLRFGEAGVWSPEAQFAGESPEDAAAVEAAQLALTPWERAGGEKRVVWIIGRQHPGESMASWWMEGFVRRLLDPEDPVARRVLRRAVVYVVPNMNPDGAIRGHLRTNAGGANLNREWGEPSLAGTRITPIHKMHRKNSHNITQHNTHTRLVRLSRRPPPSP